MRDFRGEKIKIQTGLDNPFRDKPRWIAPLEVGSHHLGCKLLISMLGSHTAIPENASSFVFLELEESKKKLNPRRQVLMRKIKSTQSTRRK